MVFPFNDDTEKFRLGRLKNGRRVNWQVHVCRVVRTSNKKAAWNALRHLFLESANIYRPLSISRKPFDGAAKGISYSGLLLKGPSGSPTWQVLIRGIEDRVRYICVKWLLGKRR
jgi:hypothetical protein